MIIIESDHVNEWCIMSVFFWIIFWIVIAAVAFLPLYFIFLFINGLLFVNMKKEYDEDSKYFRFLLNNSTAIAVWLLRIRITVTGREKLPEGRFLLVSNHRSKFDPILSWHVFAKENLSFISKPENFKVPVYGRIIHRCCFMPIDRENPRNALKTIQRAVKLIKNDVASVAVYPEGTRNYGEGLLPFHNAVLKIAQKAEVPIVVMTVKGTYEIQKNYPWRRSDVQMDIIDVLQPEEIKGVKTNILGDRIAEMMLNNLEGNAQ